jgi:hypothetical protein
MSIVPNLLNITQKVVPVSNVHPAWDGFALFICGLFNDAVSSSDYTVLNDRMINE